MSRVGREGELEAARRLSGEPSLGFSGDMRRMVVEDQLDRRTGRVSGISAKRSASVVEENGLTSTKSMVPAMRVFSPWVEKRRMALIPDSPAVIFAQFSVLPSPSDVITPMP